MTKTDIGIGNTSAYYVRHDDGTTHPSLVLVEEIWGLNDHIREVADRFAAEGYNVIAPELLPEGVLERLTPQFQKDLFDPKRRSEVQPLLREAMAPLHQPSYSIDALTTLRTCVDRLRADDPGNERVAVVGFCFGGTYSFQLAAHDARVKAAVPFYGQPPSADDVANIRCPVLAFYGSKDEALMESLPALKDAMEDAGKDFEAVVYEGTGHAFFNDTNPHAYHKKHAADAWQRTLAFLTKHLA